MRRCRSGSVLSYYPCTGEWQELYPSNVGLRGNAESGLPGIFFTDLTWSNPVIKRKIPKGFVQSELSFAWVVPKRGCIGWHPTFKSSRQARKLFPRWVRRLIVKEFKEGRLTGCAGPSGLQLRKIPVLGWTVVAEATRGQQPTSWRPSEKIGAVKGRIPKALPPVQPPFKPGLMLVTGITVMLVVALIREVMT